MPKQTGLKYADIFDKDMVEFYCDHPVEFVEDIILNKRSVKHGGKIDISWQQKDLLSSIPFNKRISVKSGKGCGKTSCVAWIIIWFLSVFKSPKVICSSPSRGQLEAALWPEVYTWLNESLVKDIFDYTATKLALKESPKDWFCMTRTASKGNEEAIFGLHKGNMLVITDEASAVEDKILRGFDETLTEDNNTFIMISNPTRTDGFFYDTHNKLKRYWCTKTYNAEESPLVAKEEIEKKLEAYGRDHDIYLTSVLGDFPKGSSNSFLKLDIVNAAVYRDTTAEGEIDFGVDVARFGDDLTVICCRQGYKVFPLVTRSQSSITDTAALVLATIKQVRRERQYSDKIRVKVDDTGVGGGLSDLLGLDRDNNIEVIPCNFGGKGDDVYQNEASMMWGTFRDCIDKVSLPNDKLLVEELSARRWGPSQSGKIIIEPKKEFKKDFGSSPDRADALMLCFAKKTNDRVVLKHFDFLDKDTVGRTPGYVSGEPYASIFYSKDRKFSMVYANWSGNKLYVREEFESDDSVYSIANEIVKRDKVEKILGNEVMFKNPGEDIRSQFQKFNIELDDNYSYDEPGAIEVLCNLVKQKRLYIDSRCTRVIDQLRGWNLSEGRSKLESSFGMCYAMLNLASLLREKIEMQDDGPQRFMSYTKQRDESIKMIDNSGGNFDAWELL